MAGINVLGCIFEAHAQTRAAQEGAERAANTASALYANMVATSLKARGNQFYPGGFAFVSFPQAPQPKPERSAWEDIEDAKDAELDAWLKGLRL